MEKSVRKKYDSSQEVEVKSNYAGKLLYESKSGLLVIWEEIGDINYMTIGDLKEMVATQRTFFKNNWVVINDDEADDIYHFLRVDDCYKNNIIVEQFIRSFKNMKASEIKKKLEGISDSLKNSIAQAVLIEYQDGRIDSLSKIKTLEKYLNTFIISNEEET